MPFYLGRKAIRRVPGTVIKAAPIPAPELIQGFGTRDQVGLLCAQAGFDSVLLVTDDTLFRLGLHEKVTSSLGAQGIRYAVFHDIHTEPTVAIVDAGRKAAAACEADCIVALGGGSVLDSSKIIAAGARHPHLPIGHYLHKFAIAEGGTLPMINIPSTAGTGAECTVGAVLKHKKSLQKALYEDLGKSPVEAYLCDIGPVIVEVNEILAGLKKWARPEKHFSGLMCFPSTSTTVYKMPYGVSLLISPFNFPILLTLGVLAASISGGNTAVIKASSKSAASTKALQELIADTFPPEYVTVIDGGHDVADLCLAERFDKIFYTGSPAVAKHVLECASHNLTSVALELGGETGNWAVIRKYADLRDAARKIVFFKLCNAGQICININQIAVAREVADAFLIELKREFTRQIGPKPEDNPEYPKLITPAVYDKCVRLTDDYRDRVVFGGTGNRDACRFAPTVIYPVGEDEDIVQHELFCPLLPVVPFPDGEIDRMMDVIARREPPLALYVFTADRKWARKVMATQQYGGGCINEVCIHMMVKGVPFNGAGHSGMGAYHGEWGFREFTHPQTVLRGRTRFNLPLREHPYSGKAGETKMTLLNLFEK